MPELKTVWTDALKVAKTYCGKNSASKKSFEKLIKPVESKLGSSLGDIDKAVQASDRDGFDKAAAKAAPLLKEAQTAYETGLTQNLYKQNDVRAFFAAVTMSKPDSINGMLRELTTEMNKIAKSPSKEQLAAQKADRKAAEAEAKAGAKQEKQQEENRAKAEKTQAAVLKIVSADEASFADYNKKLLKIKMLANERNGDLITAEAAYDKAKGDEKTKKADEFRAVHGTCVKLVALIGDMRKKPPTTQKSEKAAEKAYPHGRTKPEEITSGIDDLKDKIALADKELDELVHMLNRTIGEKKPPRASADAGKTPQPEAVARRSKMNEGVNKVREARSKTQQDDENRRARQAKQSEKLNAQDQKAQNAVLKVIAADEAKLKKFVGEVRRWKEKAVAADGGLREARDAYKVDDSKSEDLKKARAACAKLSAAYKKAEGSVPDFAKSEKAVEKVYPNGRPPRAVSDALNTVKAQQKSYAQELADLHIMLDSSLSTIHAPS